MLSQSAGDGGSVATQAIIAAGVPERATSRRRAGQRAVSCTVFVAALALLAGGAAGEPPPRFDSTGSRPSSAALPQITIEAQKDAEKRVHEFVSHVPVLSHYESLARWNTPICPLVAGLPRDDGEFVLMRLSEIAASVGAHLAPRQCHANFVVL